MILFILFLIKLLEISSYISIPFNTNFSKKNLTKENIFNSLNENRIYIELNIGTPFQKIPIYIKLREYATFILSDSNDYNIKKYSPQLSSSVKYLSEKVEKISCSKCKDGYLISEKIKLNKKSIENFSLCLADKISDNIFDLNGELGLKLSFPCKNFLKNATFIQQLREKNIIENYSFNLKYNNEFEGEFIIGNYPHEINKNYKENFFKIGKVGYANDPMFINWDIKFDEIYSGNQQIGFYKYCDLVYEKGLIVGNDIYYKSIKENFFQKLIDDKICFENDYIENNKEYFVFYCKNNLDLQKFPELIFNEKELDYNFTFNGKDLFYEFKDEYYFMVIFPKQLSGRWSFGKPFFRKYQIIFDRDRKIFGIYTYISKGFNFNLSLIIIFILVVLIILSLFYMRRIIQRNKKRRANILEDDYEYLPSNKESNKIFKNI